MHEGGPPASAIIRGGSTVASGGSSTVLEGPPVGLFHREPPLLGEGVEAGCGLLGEVAGEETLHLAQLPLGEVESEEGEQFALEVRKRGAVGMGVPVA